jgi:DNA-binding transcriptional LysR family regulator
VVFLAEARQILAHVDRAAAVARTAVSASATLRVGIIDSSYDSMPHILHEVQAHDPGLVIHQVEASVARVVPAARRRPPGRRRRPGRARTAPDRL